MDIQIRKLCNSDIGSVAELEKNCFSLPWSYESLLKEVDNENSIFAVALVDNQVLGYGGMLIVADEGDITNIAVCASHRGRGIGRAIIEFLLEEGIKKGLTAFTLEVRVSNEPAIALYRNLGFISAGVRPGFYDKPKEDALIMWKYMDNNC